ncbi:MAG: adenosylmethionine--8-amino-7-oxononanoate transaminase [Actinomycetes bacterium]
MDPAEIERLQKRDAELLWHPYATMPAARPSRVVESASGVTLTFADGSSAIDAMASWWCAVHGYRHPVLDRALRDQSESMSHVMFGGLTHRPAIELAERLLDLAPTGLGHVFLCDSGSVSVEVAIKMAVQYQRGAGLSQRSRLLTVRGGYHGDTFAAMSVCDPERGMHSEFTGVLTPQVFAPRPPAGFGRQATDPDVLAWAGHLRELARDNRDELAAIIVEPVLQGAGGMFVYSPQCLRILREVADEFDLLLIFDEIATGFGRTGAIFAADHANIAPDIMCVGKALTGGYLSMAAVMCTPQVARGIGRGPAGALMHGPTFMGNPLAAAVAVASLDLLQTSDWSERVHLLEAGLRSGLGKVGELSGVRDVRVLGATAAIEFDHEVDITRATDVALQNGVWVRPFANLVYAMPPYICTADQIAQITTAMVAAAKEVA